MRQTMRQNLIDGLSNAAIEAPPHHVSLQPITIARETRMCIFQHPDSTIKFEAMDIGRSPVLHFGCGLKEICWDRVQSPVNFDLKVIDQKGRKFEVFSTNIDVRTATGRHWHDFKVDLSKYSNQKLTVVLRTSVPSGMGASYCWAGWSDPIIEHQQEPRKVTSAKSTQKNLLVITSDALRADHLGCYGHPLVKTPHMDALAKDGAMFSHARAHTPTTLGSYATMFTGCSGIEHGLLAEWGKVPDHLKTLPGHLAANGYYTIAAVSEAEIADDPKGFTSWFQDVVPCLGVPSQSGDITARQFTKHLDRRPDRPFFGWLQFFDTHPPATPPEPFRSMYYQGDPSDPIKSYFPERVRAVRGMESILEIEPALETLPQGIIDSALIVRLRATADFLSGKADTGSDLATHLVAVGPRMCRGQGQKEFGAWLESQVIQLEQGTATPELVQWLKHILPTLREIEKDTLAWLEGVVDFRYALAQYMAEVSFLDEQIGYVVRALKERNLYDETTIVITAPHGEVLDESSIFFHHHALMEEALRIPFIMKPAKSTSAKAGTRVQGIFDQADFAPTVLESLGISNLPNGFGVSRWQSVLQGTPIPEHDSFAVDYNKVTYGIVRGDYIFLRAESLYWVSNQWNWSPGDKRLFKLQKPMSYEVNLTEQMPELATSMEKSLDEWLQAEAARKRPLSLAATRD